VTLESNSRPEAIRDSDFSHSSSLDFICIPYSAEVVRDSGFDFCRQLRAVTFEPSSKLHEICLYIFHQSVLLLSNSIPFHITILDLDCFQTRETRPKLTVEPNMQNSVIDPSSLSYPVRL
jgi:hypothetical protein